MCVVLCVVCVCVCVCVRACVCVCVCATACVRVHVRVYGWVGKEDYRAGVSCRALDAKGVLVTDMFSREGEVAHWVGSRVLIDGALVCAVAPAPVPYALPGYVCGGRGCRARRLSGRTARRANSWQRQRTRVPPP